MIICDNCNASVTKLTFCTDKCRVQHHRKADKTIQAPSNASVTPEKTPFIPSPMNDLTPLSPLPPEEPSKYPSTLYGKPLSGRKQSCPICYESVPIEFAQAHFAKEHGDI